MEINLKTETTIERYNALLMLLCRGKCLMIWKKMFTNALVLRALIYCPKTQQTGSANTKRSSITEQIPKSCQQCCQKGKRT